MSTSRHKKIYPKQLLCGGLLLLILSCSACETVKPYQRAYLNDDAMQAARRPIEKFPYKVHTYREGASGGAKGRSSGSCGCN